ncbi:MAG: hypothetical protein AB1451_14730 [Nitrospirota bacterium]
MVSRVLLVVLIAWTVTAAPAAAQPKPEADSSSAPQPRPDDASPAATKHGGGEQPSADDELIKNLDLIENLDLLDTVDVLGAVGTPNTPEEEF